LPPSSGIRRTPSRACLDREERFRAEAWRVAERRRAGLQRDPRKHRQLEIAAQRQLAAGLFLDDSLDVVAIVVRVDEHDHQHQADDDQTDQSGRDIRDDPQGTHGDSSANPGAGR
jgi:hypothetical protein